MGTQSAVLVQNVSMSDIEATLSRLLDEKLSNLQPANKQEPAKYLTRKETAAKLRVSLPTPVLVFSSPNGSAAVYCIYLPMSMQL